MERAKGGLQSIVQTVQNIRRRNFLHSFGFFRGKLILHPHTVIQEFKVIFATKIKKKN